MLPEKITLQTPLYTAGDLVTGVLVGLKSGYSRCRKIFFEWTSNPWRTGSPNGRTPMAQILSMKEAARLIDTRCAQGGTTILFQPSRSASDRERLAYGLVYLALLQSTRWP